MSRLSGLLAMVFFLLLLIGLFAIAGDVWASPPRQYATPPPTPKLGQVATAAEVQKAQAEWSRSRHANTFDNGQGANTTCARCKSPRNWDPTESVAQELAHDCAACKRVPGTPRPALEGGMTVPQEEWHNIGCEVCHLPAGNSYLTSIAFWNQAADQYEAVKNATELCAKCHEGTHGFEVIMEQTVSVAHKGWDCTKCHGAHGSPSTCTSCHDPTVGKGAPEHTRHQGTNCTACHDAGGLSLWHDDDRGSRHFDEYVPIRFAHALRSWTSHNLSVQVVCQRCHHPRTDGSGPISSQVVCQDCHDGGAVLFWCEKFPRNPDPNATPMPGMR